MRQFVVIIDEDNELDGGTHEYHLVRDFREIMNNELHLEFFELDESQFFKDDKDE